MITLHRLPPCRLGLKPARPRGFPTARWSATTVRRRGILSMLPAPMVPFAELSRLEKPAGTMYLFMPCLFGTLLASCVVPAEPISIAKTSLLFLAGAAVMRGAGCTINDLYDRQLDRLVSRTRLRPLARDAVSVPAALGWFSIQCLAGLGVLLQFSSNTIALALPSMFLVFTYPLAKRVTHYPQAVLGCAFSWGVLLGFPAMGVDMVNFSALGLYQVADSQNLLAAGLLYASCIVWTLLYDTVYAFQDIKDDRKAGIKSTAQAFSSKDLVKQVSDDKPKTVLYGLAALQTALLAGSGIVVGLSPVFFLTSCGGCAATLTLLIRRVNLQDPASCAWWFKNCCWFTGGTISFGLLLEYLCT